MNEKLKAKIVIVSTFIVLLGGLYGLQYLVEKNEPVPEPSPTLKLEFKYIPGIWVLKLGKYNVVIYNEEPEIRFFSASVNEALEYSMKTNGTISLMSGWYELDPGIVYINKTLHLGPYLVLKGANLDGKKQTTPLISIAIGAEKVVLTNCTFRNVRWALDVG